MKIKTSLFILIISATAFTSCSRESKIKSNIENYVQNNFNDPSSYELIDLHILDTLTESKYASSTIKIRNAYILSIQNYLKQRKEEIGQEAMSAFMSGNGFTLLSASKRIKNEEAELKQYTTDSIPIARKEIEKLKKFTKSNKVLYYRYSHEYRAKNSLGALVKEIDTLRIDDEANVLENYIDFITKKMKL